MIKLTFAEFEKNFSLHDSSLEKIFYDKKNNRLTLTIEFCFWMQNWFVEGEPTNGKISATFENVSLFQYEQHDFKNFLENLDTEIIIREYVDYPLKMDFWRIKIKSKNVEVTELERYNL